MKANIKVNITFPEQAIVNAIIRGTNNGSAKNLDTTKQVLSTSQPDIYTDRVGLLSILLKEAGLNTTGGELNTAWHSMIKSLNIKMGNTTTKFNIFDASILDTGTKWIGKAWKPSFRNNPHNRGTMPALSDVVVRGEPALESTGGSNVIDGFRPLPAGKSGKWTWGTNPYKGQGYWRIYEDGYISSRGEYGINYQPRYFIKGVYSYIFSNSYSSLFGVGKLNFTDTYLKQWKQSIYDNINMRLQA